MNFKTSIWIAATPLLFGCATRPSITKEQADEIFAATNKACDTRFDKNHDPMWGECFISMLTTLDPRTPLPLRVPTPKFECYELCLMPGTEPFSECVSREELTLAIHQKKYAQQIRELRLASGCYICSEFPVPTSSARIRKSTILTNVSGESSLASARERCFQTKPIIRHAMVSG